MTFSAAVPPAKEAVQTGFIPAEECSRLHLIADGQGVFYGPASQADSADGAAAVLGMLKTFADVGVKVTLCPEGFARQPGSALGGGAAPTKLFRGTSEPQAARDGRVGMMTSGGATQAVAAAAQSVAAGSLGPLIDSAQSRSEGEATVAARVAQELAEGRPLLSVQMHDSSRAPVPTLSTFSTSAFPLSHRPFHQHDAAARPRPLDIESYSPTPTAPLDISTYASSPVTPFPRPQAVLTVTARSCQWDALPQPAADDASQKEQLPVPTAEEWRDVQLAEPMSAEERRAVALRSVIGGGPELPWERRQASGGDEQAVEGAGAAASGSRASEGEARTSPVQEPERRAAAVPAVRGVAAFILDTDACALLPAHTVVVRRARVVDGGLIIQYYVVGDVLSRMIEDMKRSTLGLHKTLCKVKLPPKYEPHVKDEDVEDVKRVVVKAEGDLDESGQPAAASLEPLEPLDLTLDSDSDDDVDSGVGVSASPVLGKRKAAVAFPSSSSGSDSDLEIDEARSAPPARARAAAAVKDEESDDEEEDGDVQVIAETLKPPPGSLRAGDQLPLVHLAHQWGVEELTAALEDDNACLEAILLGSSLRDDDSSLTTHRVNPELCRRRRFYGPTRLVALAFLCKGDTSRMYNILSASGETSLHGFTGAMRAFVARIITLGTFNSYTTPHPVFLVTMCPLPAAGSLLARLLNHPLFLPPDVGNHVAGNHVALTPANVFRFVTRIGTLPKHGMTSLSPSFEVGTAGPGTRSPLAGTTALWTPAERMAQVPPHVVAAAERRARPSAQSSGWSLPPQWQGSRDMWDERRGDDEWTGWGWIPPEGPLAEEQGASDIEGGSGSEGEGGSGSEGERGSEEEEEDEEGGEVDLERAGRRRRAAGTARRVKARAAQRREMVGAYGTLLRALLGTPAWSSFVARGRPDEEVLVYDVDWARFGVLSARLDAVVGCPSRLTIRAARSAVQDLMDELEDVDYVERYFPAEGISARLFELSKPLAPLIRQFATLCEVPTMSGPVETLLALELDGVFEPVVDSVLSLSPLMLEKAVSSRAAGTVLCEALCRAARSLKASKPGVDEVYVKSLKGRERKETRRTARDVCGLGFAMR